MAPKPPAPQRQVAELEPGPGEYEATAAQSGPAFTIGAKVALQAEHGEGDAGPAAYDVPASFPAGPAYTMAERAMPSAEAEPTPGTLWPQLQARLLH